MSQDLQATQQVKQSEKDNIVSILEAFFNETLEETLRIYEKEVFVGDTPIFSQLHELMEENEEDHNCIGCNLGEYAMLNYSTLLLLDGLVSIEQKMQLLIINLYLLVERIDTILDIIKLHEGYRKENFKTLSKIRKWANFIKHPKAFILAHHPVYTIEGFKDNKEIRIGASITIDTSFIIKYYSNDEKNKELFKAIENKEGILVVFPNPADLIEKLCEELKLFNKLLRNNEIYREILKKRSTFLGFWLDEEE